MCVDLVSHYDCKGVSNLCESSCIVAPVITFIFLITVWSKGNGKIRYFSYELAANLFYGQALTVINPVTSEMSVYCCYFELDFPMNEKYISISIILLCMYMPNILLCLSFFFICFATYFRHYKYFFVTLHPSSFINRIPCYIILSLYFLCGNTLKIPWGNIYKMPQLTVIPTYIYLIRKIHSLLTNKVALAAQVI